MIFGPELIGKVMDGTKTVTRRRFYGSAPGFGWGGPTRYKVGRTYAVQPGRGKPAVGRILITGVRTERLREITVGEARREGFGGFGRCALLKFRSYWRHLHGTWNPEQEVAVIEFEVVK